MDIYHYGINNLNIKAKPIRKEVEVLPSKNINKKTSNNNNSKQTQSEDFLKLYKEYKIQNPDSQSEDFLKFWNGYQESQLEKLKQIFILI